MQLESLELRTLLAYTAQVNLAAQTVTFTGDGASDLLILDSDSRGRLRHNRFTAGDPGFASDIDLDSTLAGVQSATTGTGIFINAGDGDDTVTIGSASVPVSDLDVPVTVDGQGGTDRLNLDDSANPRGTEETPSVLTRDDLDGFIMYSNLEHLLVQGGSGVDEIIVESTDDETATTLQGGAGNDTATVQSAGLAGLTLDGQQGADTAIIRFGDLAGPVFVVDYGASFTGSDEADAFVLTDTSLTDGQETIDLTNSAVTPTVSGGGGNDTIDASQRTRPAVLDGGAGNDSLVGSNQDETLTGGSGDDTIHGGGGVNRLEESASVDFTLTDASLIGLGTDSLQGVTEVFLDLSGAALRAARGAPSGRTVNATGFSGKLEVRGGPGADSIVGGSGSDFLNGMEGDDSLNGGGGNDVLAGGDGNDELLGDDGDDTLIGGAGEDLLNDTIGNNMLVSGPGRDMVNGVLEPAEDCTGLARAIATKPVVYAPKATAAASKSIKMTLTNRTGAAIQIVGVVPPEAAPYEIVSVTPALPRTIPNGAKVKLAVLTRRAAGLSRATAQAPFFTITMECNVQVQSRVVERSAAKASDPPPVWLAPTRSEFQAPDRDESDEEQDDRRQDRIRRASRVVVAVED